ncbi:MAG: 3-hydroxymethylcephem carbamoyltransferase [Defluviicoccus sp.]|nr:3-hydroxymethylcephem carbamoyltransferase [Defluviicoccus sp.]
MFSIESEKDSHYRYSALSIPHVLDAIGEIGELPNVICTGGWWPVDHHEFLFGSLRNSGYRGIHPKHAIIQSGRFFKGKVDYFSSSHERSHILCAFGMSTLPKGTPFYALVWEGVIGAFYEIDSEFNITLLGDVLQQPGNRYGMLYGLADPTFPKDGPYPRQTDAGKLMALASFSQRSEPTPDERKLLRFLLDGPYRKLSDYEDINCAPHLNAGVDNPEFRNFAGIYSDAIFEVFYQFAETNMRKELPLVIAGGCGLNCDWNSKWVGTGLFSEVFVPPVANDSGSAIGTAIDAQLHFTHDPKIDWNVYSGLSFQEQGVIDASKYDIYEPNVTQIADILASGLIVAWVSGKYEIGPRALGNRSILAAPFRNANRIRLNQIKQREQFRPIAPTCLREDAATLFGCNHDSPHMLYTFQTNTDVLPAVTHVNRTARIQTVTPDDNEMLYDLLTAFKQRTGHGVLCNTSLNFNGKGCINNIVDLDAYTLQHGLDGFVLEGRAYMNKSSKLYQEYRRSSSKLPRSASLQPNAA